MRLFLKISSSCFCCLYFMFLLALFLGDGQAVIMLSTTTTSAPPSSTAANSEITSTTNKPVTTSKATNTIHEPEISTTSMPETISISKSSKSPRIVFMPQNNMSPTMPIYQDVEIHSPHVSTVYKLPPLSSRSNIEKLLVEQSGLPPSLNVSKSNKIKSKSRNRNHPKNHYLSNYQNYGQDGYSGNSNTASRNYNSNVFGLPMSAALSKRSGNLRKRFGNATSVKYGHAGLQVVSKNLSVYTDDENEQEVTIARPASLKFNTSSGNVSKNVQSSERPSLESISSLKSSGTEIKAPDWLNDKVTPAPESDAAVTTGTISDFQDFFNFRQNSSSNYDSNFRLDTIRTVPFSGNTNQNVTFDTNGDHVTDILERFRTSSNSTQRTFPSYDDDEDNLRDSNFDSSSENSSSEMSNSGLSQDQLSAADIFMRNLDTHYHQNDKFELSDLKSSSSDDNKNGDSTTSTSESPINLEGVRVRNQIRNNQDNDQTRPSPRSSPRGNNNHLSNNHPSNNHLSNQARYPAGPSSTLTSKASADILPPKTESNNNHNPPARIPVRGLPRVKPNQNNNNNNERGLTPPPHQNIDLEHERPPRPFLLPPPTQSQFHSSPYSQPSPNSYPSPYYPKSSYLSPSASNEQSNKQSNNEIIQELEGDKSGDTINEAEGVFPGAVGSGYATGHLGGHPYGGIGGAVGGGIGVAPGYNVRPPVFLPGLPPIQTKVTCCKTYYPPPLPPPLPPVHFPPPPIYHPASSLHHPFHAPPMEMLMSPMMNEIPESDSGNHPSNHQRNTASSPATSSSNSNGNLVAKADGSGSYDAGAAGGAIGGNFGPHPGYPYQGFKLGDSYCFHEPILPHPLELKQLKINKLLYPFILKKRFFFNFG